MKFGEESMSRLFALATAAVFALALAGCGGGGKGSDGAARIQETALEIAEAAVEAATRAEALVAEAPDHPVSAARKALATEAAKAARAAATAALAAAEAGDLAEAQRQGEIALARLGDAEDALRAAALLVENLSGPSVVSAAQVLAMERGIMDAATSSGAPFDSRMAAENYRVEVNASDGSVTLTDLNEAGPADDEALAPADGAPHGDRGDWTGAGFSRENTNDAMEVVSSERVVVYTDVDEPEAVPFSRFTNVAGEATQALDARDLDAAVDADGDGDPANDFTALAVDGSSGAVLALVESSAFTAGARARLTFESDDANTPEDEAFETTGVYNGARGVYRCDGASACTVDLDAAGGLTAMSADWTFTPDAGATSPQPDHDYMWYGYWVKSSENAEGGPVYEVQTFSGGSIPYDAASLGASGATATYEGKAAGTYAQKLTYSPEDGALTGGRVGDFVADVRLKAYFGTPTSVAADDHNSVSGVVTNFMDGAVDLGWRAELKRMKFDALSAGGETSGGTGTGAGRWTAGFFGSAEGDFDHDGDPGTPAMNRRPTDVAGEFTAHFSNGHAAGAYGANRKD